MSNIVKTDSSGVIYELNMPPCYMQADCSEEDKQVYMHFVSVMQDLIDNPTIARGIIIPQVLDENGKDAFTFKVHKTVKYRYRETILIGEIQHTIEADTLEEFIDLRGIING